MPQLNKISIEHESGSHSGGNATANKLANVVILSMRGCLYMVFCSFLFSFVLVFFVRCYISFLQVDRSISYILCFSTLFLPFFQNASRMRHLLRFHHSHISIYPHTPPMQRMIILPSSIFACATTVNWAARKRHQICPNSYARGASSLAS